MPFWAKVPLPFLFKHLLRFYPPYLGAGIKVTKVAEDMSYMRVEMGLHRWNANYVGTQFGGSLYSMTDPFYMLMLMNRLGKEYIVWDKVCTIRYLSPGKGRVFADFHLPTEEVERIRHEADSNYKIEPVFVVRVLDEKGVAVAEVDKTLYVRRKDRTRKLKDAVADSASD